MRYQTVFLGVGGSGRGAFLSVFACCGGRATGEPATIAVRACRVADFTAAKLNPHAMTMSRSSCSVFLNVLLWRGAKILFERK
jgi:hypothetical protein